MDEEIKEYTLGLVKKPRSSILASVKIRSSSPYSIPYILCYIINCKNLVRIALDNHIQTLYI